MKLNFWTVTTVVLAIFLGCTIWAWPQADGLRIDGSDFINCDANGVSISLDVRTYEEGVNDALECLALLSLELQLAGERKTFGEMLPIVCDRLKVGNRAANEEAIRHLCRSGRVCEVVGHQWDLVMISTSGSGALGEWDSGRHEEKCGVCGKSRVKTWVPSHWTDWQ